MSAETWEGPWRIEGPWHHDSGYPQTWSVANAHRTLCDAPTEQGADMIRHALNALAVVERERDTLRDALRNVERVAADHEGVTPEAYELITDFIRAAVSPEGEA